jgi:hypothetical protein
MKTAMQELIDKIKIECSSGKITEEQNYILIWAIYMAEGLLEKEKELACQFAKEYINGEPPRSGEREVIIFVTFNFSSR